MATLLIGCQGTWRELSFTRARPDPSALVGIWVPTTETLADMRDVGGYPISKHELRLQADGQFSMTNMPDWWREGFGRSSGTFESGAGKWELREEDGAVGPAWVIDLEFPQYGTSVHLVRQKDPYMIHVYIGDPDSGHAMLFERTAQ